MPATKTYYKATRSDGVIACRATTMKFTHAAIHRPGSDSAGSSWFGRPESAAKAKPPKRHPKSEVVPAVEITAAEFRALKAALQRETA